MIQAWMMYLIIKVIALPVSDVQNFQLLCVCLVFQCQLYLPFYVGGTTGACCVPQYLKLSKQ